jgi:hypothetical protein
MTKSRLEIPFSDFEDNVMNEISLQKKKQELMLNYLKLSWIFFAMGSLFGITIALLFDQFDFSSLGISSAKLQPFVLAIVVLVLIFQADYLFNYQKKMKSKQ